MVLERVRTVLYPGIRIYYRRTLKDGRGVMIYLRNATNTVRGSFLIDHATSLLVLPGQTYTIKETFTEKRSRTP